MPQRTFLLCLILWAAQPAGAAPVRVTIDLTLDIPRVGLITAAGSGTVTVTGSHVSVPGGLLAGAAPVTVPVTATTTASSLSIVGLDNATGTFSRGGITALLPGEVCPTPTIPAQSACNAGGGIGGRMGLFGVLSIGIVPGVALPLDLALLRVGLGGSTAPGFRADAAGWTTWTGRVNATGTTLSVFGSSSPLVLVSPTFVAGGGALIPVVATLTLEHGFYVPEPAGLALVAFGLLGLRWVARGRPRPSG